MHGILCACLNLIECCAAYVNIRLLRTSRRFRDGKSPRIISAVRTAL